ncbi:MAG: aldo/keto reductase [Gammaproteobacteria bacterium]|nr:aldo/keto reductase [Gammaproteobacteria bacterium]
MNTTKISLGTVQFGVDYGINSASGQVKSNEVINILNYAQQRGINLLDTAPSYGNSEQVLGVSNIQNFKIVTKTRHFDQNTISDKDCTLLMNDLDQSLHLLKQKSVYGVLVHNANDLLKPGADKIVRQLEILKKQGLASKIGVSVYGYEQLEIILNNFDIDLVQLPFNIFDRRLIDSGMFKTLKNKGVEIHARSVFLQGLLLMDMQNRASKFDRWKDIWKIWHEWLNDNQITALEATIRYAISLPEISKVLVGVDTKDQLEEIIIASNGGLPNVPKELFVNDADLLNPTNWGRL